MNSRLAGKVAVVTGGASGIGRACALALATAGADVVIIDRDGPAADGVAAEVVASGGRASAYAFDLVDVAGIGQLVDTVMRSQSRLDILVNAAGVTDPDRTFLDVDLEAWRRVQAINSEAPFFMMQAVAKVMIAGGAGGRIVNITSASAFRAAMSFPAYGPSKAALTHSTRVAAAALAPYDINVNNVAPGLTVTPILAVSDKFASVQALVESGPLSNLLKRPSLPEDVANAVLFLCLPESRQITAQTLHTSAGGVV